MIECSENCFRNWEITAQWFAALGTIGAASLALLFGLRGRGERLTIGFSIDERNLAIFVVNSSDRPVHLDELELEIGRWWPRTSADIDIDLDMMLTKPNRTPEVIGPHDSRTYRVHLGDDSSYLAGRVQRAWSERTRLDRRLFLVVVTGERARIRLRLPKGVKNALLEHGRRANRN
jgi:hypothetical protein